MKRALRAVSVVLLLLLQAGPAGAHAAYESSDPADKATVSSPPSEVEATFTEPVTSDSFLEVTDPCGDVVSGASRPVADTITVSMSGTRAGKYSVYFRVQSSVDSHITDGTFSFASSGGDPCPGAEQDADEKPEPRDGGGGGGSNDSGGGGGASTGDTSGSSTAPGSGSAVGSADPSNEGGSPGGNAKGERNQKGKRGNGGAQNDDEVRLSIQEDEKPKRRSPDPWDLPMDGLIVALVLAGLIGAAGGRIYAAILGPRT